MKKLITILLALSLLIIVVPGVQAYSVNITRYSGYYSGVGGEFSLLPSADFNWYMDNYAAIAKYGSTRFETFCVETNENISLNHTYDATISYTTIATGVHLNIGTAWLYNQFARGILDGYNYFPGAERIASADALQDAIWYLMGNPSIGDGATFYNKAIAANSNVWEYANVGNIYGVAVLNLFAQEGSGENYYRQDQLIFVPEPATLLLLGSGLLGLALYRRKNS